MTKRGERWQDVPWGAYIEADEGWLACVFEHGPPWSSLRCSWMVERNGILIAEGKTHDPKQARARGEAVLDALQEVTKR